MELIVIIRMLCICLALLLTPCASLLSDQLQSSHDLGGHDQQVTLPTLPRKLKVLMNEVATANEDVHGAHKVLNKQTEEVLSGKSHQKEAQVMQARVGTRQEWIQGSETDTSQYFTMDYSHVRRRRPIHNKSIPVAP